MRKSNWTPSIVPGGDDHDVYLVLDDFGRNGQAWREADVETTDLETVTADLLGGQFNNPVRVVGFNTAEGWSQDVSADVAASFVDAAMSRRATCRSSYRDSWIDTKAGIATCSCRCRSASCDRWLLERSRARRTFLWRRYFSAGPHWPHLFRQYP